MALPPRRSSGTYHDATIYAADAALLDGPHWINDHVIVLAYEYLAHEVYAGRDDLCFVHPGAAAMLIFGDAEDVTDIAGGLGFASKRAIFIPLTDHDGLTEASGGSHWTLLCVSTSTLCVASSDAAGESKKVAGSGGGGGAAGSSEEGAAARPAACSCTFTYFDSMGGGLTRAAQRVADKIGAYFGAVAVQASSPAGAGSVETRVVVGKAPKQMNGYDCGIYVIAMTEFLAATAAAAGLTAGSAAGLTAGVAAGPSVDMTEAVSAAACVAKRRELHRQALLVLRGPTESLR